jgi:hypothetical protein
VDAEARYRQLLVEVAAEFPRFRLVPKDHSWFQRCLDLGLRLVTLGGQTRYLDGYVTTIGQRIYVPRDWEARPAAERYLVLRHERVHLRQFRRFGLPLMAVLYLLFPLPLGLAWVRMRLEREAYEETLRATAAWYGRAAVCDPAFRAHIVEQFVSPAYGWMWPFRRAIERWYDGVVATLPPS